MTGWRYRTDSAAYYRSDRTEPVIDDDPVETRRD
jgi:hypothetical protein